MWWVWLHPPLSLRGGGCVPVVTRGYRQRARRRCDARIKAPVSACAPDKFGALPVPEKRASSRPSELVALLGPLAGLP